MTSVAGQGRVVMFPAQRRRWLLQHARVNGRIDVTRAADELQVAQETIRRDLSLLEGSGAVRRIHGGAIPIERVGFEIGIAERVAVHEVEKRRIAEHAASLLDAADSVYIDGGSTCTALAEQLVAHPGLTVVTNSVHVLTVLTGAQGIEVLMLGGRVRRDTMATADDWAKQTMRNVVVDVAFIGASGLSCGRGLTCPDAAGAGLKSLVLQQSRTAHLLVDSSKLGVDSTFRFADVADVSTVVTDRRARAVELRDLRGRVEVVTV